jgi:hypothetical protein
MKSLVCSALVAVALLLLAGCGDEGRSASSSAAASEESTPSPASSSAAAVPTSLTCPNNGRAISDVPYTIETIGAATPVEVVQAWLTGWRLGPDYVMDATKKHGWALRADGTAEAVVTVELTEGGYSYYGHEACG